MSIGNPVLDEEGSAGNEVGQSRNASDNGLMEMMEKTSASGGKRPNPHRIENILKEDVITSMAIGFLPFPILDAAMLMALQVSMVHDLCREYGVPFAKKRAVAALSGAIGALPVVSVLGLGSVIKVVPVLGTVGAGATLAVASGALTYAQGRLLVHHLSSGGTLGDFEPKRMGDALRRELLRGRALAKALIPIARKSANPHERLNRRTLHQQSDPVPSLDAGH